jgi:hypothetical protein
MTWTQVGYERTFTANHATVQERRKGRTRRRRRDQLKLGTEFKLTYYTVSSDEWITTGSNKDA